jgi:hypothetical protein
MEITNSELSETAAQAPTADQEAAALDIIRTETVLSRLPIHNLAKKGSVNIQIIKTTPDGKVELKWIVSYSDRYGQARQLAYKLDTIVINHHIDEQGRPLPKMICLGSLRDVADQLNLGGDTNKVRRALRQNASAFITAKFEYRGNDGSKKTLEADFTRYSVVFTGEQLPDGRRADAVYIILNEPYREVLNNAPIRPLDRAYMKMLPPAAQRFYEIISYKIFSAIKNDYPHANISYSEYCTFSAQLRHFERQPVQDQMAKIIRHHKQSGYITAVKYQSTIDADNKPDWIMFLTPGPKARAEFAAAHTRRKVLRQGDAKGNETRDDRQKRNRSMPGEVESTIELAPLQPKFDPVLFSELTRRGINEKKAHELLANLKPGQDQNLIAQLEYAEQTIEEMGDTPNPVRNPAGFIISLVEHNAMLPDNFETSAQRTARLERERKEGERRAAKEARQQLEWEYDDYRDRETDRYIQANAAAFETLKDAKWKEDRERFTFTTESVARIAARNEMQKQITFLTFEEFLERKKQGTDFFLKLVPLSPAPEIASRSAVPDDILSADEMREAKMNSAAATEETAIGSTIQSELESSGGPETEVAVAEMESANGAPEPLPTVKEPEAGPAVPEITLAKEEMPPASGSETQTTPSDSLMIELVSDPALADSLDITAEQGMA